jgi:hypothetical protein
MLEPQWQTSVNELVLIFRDVLQTIVPPTRFDIARTA